MAHSSRRLSLCTVMQSIVHDGPISRARIARETGLSKQTVGEIVSGLEIGGWVREKGRTRGHVGRTATTYETVGTAAGVVVVDLGGTKLRAAVADLAGNILDDVVEPTDPAGGAAVARQTARLCRVATERNAIGWDRIKLAIVGVAGVPDASTGAVRLSPNIRGLDRINLRSSLEDALGVDVYVENDVNLAIIGEQWIGSGAGEKDLVFIAVGTGIGAGIMIGGTLVRGAAQSAGELGYLPVGADPFEAESLRTGALERVVGTIGIMRRYRDRTGEEADVPAIFDAATRGNLAASAVVDETASHLACAITAVCATVNPAKVILGGSIGSRPDLARRIRTILPQCAPIPVEVETSLLGSYAALAGGAAVGFEKIHAMLFSDGHPGALVSLPRQDANRFRLTGQ